MNRMKSVVMSVIHDNPTTFNSFWAVNYLRPVCKTGAMDNYNYLISRLTKMMSAVTDYSVRRGISLVTIREYNHVLVENISLIRHQGTTDALAFDYVLMIDMAGLVETLDLCTFEELEDRFNNFRIDHACGLNPVLVHEMKLLMEEYINGFKIKDEIYISRIDARHLVVVLKNSVQGNHWSITMTLYAPLEDE